MTLELSVIVPIYNEGPALRGNLQHISEYLSRSFPEHEIIGVDDGSTDETPKVLQECEREVPRLRFLRSPENRGKGMAVRLGIDRARGTWVALVDADLELPIEMLEEFFRVQRATGAQVVVGSKRHPASQVEYPRLRWFLSRAYGRLLRVLFELPVSDTQVGFKLLHRPTVQSLSPALLVKRFAFDVELIVLLHRAQARFAEAPVRLHFSRPGGGRVRLPTVLNIVRETAGIWFRLYITGFYGRPRVPAAPAPASPLGGGSRSSESTRESAGSALEPLPGPPRASPEALAPRTGAPKGPSPPA
jgi:glycosyltransferase involved in cell wall biosynthesis